MAVPNLPPALPIDQAYLRPNLIQPEIAKGEIAKKSVTVKIQAIACIVFAAIAVAAFVVSCVFAAELIWTYIPLVYNTAQFTLLGVSLTCLASIAAAFMLNHYAKANQNRINEACEKVISEGKKFDQRKIEFFQRYGHHCTELTLPSNIYGAKAGACFDLLLHHYRHHRHTDPIRDMIILANTPENRAKVQTFEAYEDLFYSIDRYSMAEEMDSRMVQLMQNYHPQQQPQQQPQHIAQQRQSRLEEFRAKLTKFTNEAVSNLDECWTQDRMKDVIENSQDISHIDLNYWAGSEQLRRVCHQKGLSLPIGAPAQYQALYL